MSSEKQEVWLLKVYHPSHSLRVKGEIVEFPPGWGIVGVFKTPDGAKKAFEKLMKVGRIGKDEAGNSWELKRFDVRD